MKRNRICYLLAIIAMCTAFNVYAANYTIKGWSSCSVDQGSTIKYSTGNKYEYHIQSVKPQGGGKDMTMYCTYPQKDSHYVNPQTNPPNMTCELASTTNFPTSYKLLKYIQTNGSPSDRVLDIAFRMAGIYDRTLNKTLVVTSGSNYQLKAFYNTYLTKVLGQTNTGFTELLEGGEVDTAIDYLKKSKDLDISDMKPSDNPDAEKDIFSMELLEEKENYKIYKVTSKRNLSHEPIVTGNNIHYEWVEKWNLNKGKIKISSVANNCNGSITFSTDVEVGNSSAIYDCSTNNTAWQNFIAIGPSKAGDSFEVTTCPQPDCIKSGCGVIEKADEIKEKDIHNCCEEGATTKVRQAALNELFCKDGTLKIDYYKPKCNAETYIESSSEFCKMYCGSTAMYRLPGPSRAKSDAYFYFDKTTLGITGPILNQYKRCRNIIYFDKWVESYNGNNNLIVNSLNDYNMYVTQLNQINNTTGHDHVETIVVSCPPEAGRSTPTVTRHDVHMTQYNVASASYNKFKADLDNRSYRTMTLSDNGTGQSPSGTYYDQSSINAYNDKRNQLVNSNSGCEVSGNSFTSKESIKAEVEKNANSALANYNEAVRASGDLRKGLTQCTGSANANGVVDTSELKDKVKFGSEPEMEFSYNQVYLNDAGNLVSQELKIDFEKIDGKCAYAVYDTLDKPNKNSEDWNENWDIIGIYDDQYSGNFGTGVLSVDTVKAKDQFGTTVNSISSIKDNQFYASKKFTTDAVGHMTCRWQDSPKNKTYTLIPRGIVYTEIVKEGDIKELGKQYTEHTGTYQIVKTHASGKFETYFTLKNLADGIFDDIIHDGGKTCAELYAEISGGKEKPKDDEVNATCYIDIESTGWTLYDCTQRDVVSKDENLANMCCDNPPCTGSSLLEYKEVDPANIFPNEYGDKYAWNWYKGPNGQQVMKTINDNAESDKTYARDQLTYSFTLTPKDLKAIRAYNKGKIKEGGYTDFNMNCKYVEENGRSTYQRCESNFLTAISGGTPVPYGNGEKLELKTNNTDLNKLRQNW